MALDFQSDTLMPQALGFAPGHVVRLFGMRRSGNHAIADWILRNSPAPGSVFLNNCTAGKSALASCRSVAINRQKTPLAIAQQDFSTVCHSVTNGGLLLVSYEDTVPQELQQGPEISRDLDGVSIDTNVVLYRGFLNWSASMLRKLQRNAGLSVVRRAATLLRAMDGYGRMLALVDARDAPHIITICYDDWVKSEAYRAEALTRMGLQLTDNTLGSVQQYGGGSSFQNDARSADELQTDLRWRQMSDDPDYRDLMRLASRDTALVDHISRVFPTDAKTLAKLAKGGVL